MVGQFLLSLVPLVLCVLPVFSRDSTRNAPWTLFLGGGGRPYNPVHFQSGSGLRFGGREEGVWFVWESSSQLT